MIQTSQATCTWMCESLTCKACPAVCWRPWQREGSSHCSENRWWGWTRGGLWSSLYLLLYRLHNNYRHKQRERRDHEKQKTKTKKFDKPEGKDKGRGKRGKLENSASRSTENHYYLKTKQNPYCSPSLVSISHYIMSSCVLVSSMSSLKLRWKVCSYKLNMLHFTKITKYTESHWTVQTESCKSIEVFLL